MTRVGPGRTPTVHPSSRKGGGRGWLYHARTTVAAKAADAVRCLNMVAEQEFANVIHDTSSQNVIECDVDSHQDKPNIEEIGSTHTFPKSENKPSLDKPDKTAEDMILILFVTTSFNLDKQFTAHIQQMIKLEVSIDDNNEELNDDDDLSPLNPAVEVGKMKLKPAEVEGTDPTDKELIPS